MVVVHCCRRAISRCFSAVSLSGRCLVLFALALCAIPAFPQSSPPPARALPMGFRGISLGMGLDQVKQALKADPLFRYRGDPDVSFLPQTSQYLIECDGNSYLRRAYFQFADSRLFIMILVLDTLKLDHYSLFSALSAKYGAPTSLDPQAVRAGPLLTGASPDGEVHRQQGVFRPPFETGRAG